jgi:hypothetical protein
VAGRRHPQDLSEARERRDRQHRARARGEPRVARSEDREPGAGGRADEDDGRDAAAIARGSRTG